MPYYVHDKIISPNVWDEQWDIGSISNATGENINGGYLRSKNLVGVIPNKTYYLKRPSDTIIWLYAYDANGNFLRSFNNGAGYIAITAGNYNFTMPSNVYYIRFLISLNYGATYNHDICINVSDPAINGNYYPYNLGCKRYIIKDNNNSMNIGG